MRRVARCQFVVCLGRGERGREGEKWGLISVCDMCKIWLGKEKRRRSRAEQSIAEDSGCGGLSEDRRAPRRQLFDPLVSQGEGVLKSLKLLRLRLRVIICIQYFSTLNGSPFCYDPINCLKTWSCTLQWPLSWAPTDVAQLETAVGTWQSHRGRIF